MGSPLFFIRNRDYSAARFNELAQLMGDQLNAFILNAAALALP